jgi:hypothetical protein
MIIYFEMVSEDIQHRVLLGMGLVHEVTLQEAPGHCATSRKLEAQPWDAGRGGS